MNARTLRRRLSAHGQLLAHRDGRYTLRLVRPAEEGYHTPALMRVVEREVPGAVCTWRCRRAADRYFEVHEVLFRLGPETKTQDARERAVSEGTRYPIPSPATSAEIAGEEGGSALSAVKDLSCREDATAGRDRHFESPLGRGADPRAESRATVTTTNGTMEGSDHEVAKAEGAVVPARMSDSPGKRPGSSEGPGRVSPGDVVGREHGRAA